jgi:hypothetical protein
MTEEISVRTRPRRASSVASRLARAASVSRAMAAPQVDFPSLRQCGRRGSSGVCRRTARCRIAGPLAAALHGVARLAAGPARACPKRSPRLRRLAHWRSAGRGCCTSASPTSASASDRRRRPPTRVSASDRAVAFWKRKSLGRRHAGARSPVPARSRRPPHDPSSRNQDRSACSMRVATRGSLTASLSRWPVALISVRTPAITTP